MDNVANNVAQRNTFFKNNSENNSDFQAPEAPIESLPPIQYRKIKAGKILSFIRLCAYSDPQKLIKLIKKTKQDPNRPPKVSLKKVSFYYEEDTNRGVFLENLENPDTDTGKDKNKQRACLVIDNFSHNKGLRNTALRLLQRVNNLFTEAFYKTSITLNVNEYMKECGLKNRKAMMETVKEDVQTIKDLKTQTKDSGLFNLFSDIQPKRGGLITFTLSKEFYRIYSHFRIMPYAFASFKIDLSSRQHENTIFFNTVIHEHKNMNIGKTNEDYIGVITLLESTPYTPTETKLNETGRKHQGNRYRLKPMERDLDHLAAILPYSWEYSKDGKPISRKEAQKLTYRKILALSVHFTWQNYPQTTFKRGIGGYQHPLWGVIAPYPPMKIIENE